MRPWNAILVNIILISTGFLSTRLILTHLSLNLPVACALPASSDISHAKETRTKYGHEAAAPFYQNLLKEAPDWSAALRIAASERSPWRQDQACPVPSVENDKISQNISKLSRLLQQSHYDNDHVKQIFGIPTQETIKAQRSIDMGDSITNDKNRGLAFMQGPVFIKPIGVGSKANFPFFHATDEVGVELCEQDSSLKCLIVMFLLGFAVPKEILIRHLMGGWDTIQLLQDLGLAFLEEDDTVVPYVHLFPLDVHVVGRLNQKKTESRNKSMVLVTDCHPTILSRTTVGRAEDGAVMYTGPDSLALVQHIPLEDYIQRRCLKTKQDDENRNEMDPFRILDFCTGSGIQALSLLLSLSDVSPKAAAVCVDINPRALRFTRFNALLNGIENERIQTIEADLINQVVNRADQSDDSKTKDLLDYLLLGDSLYNTGDDAIQTFDVVLSNPPFIPVPPISSQKVGERDECGNGTQSEQKEINSIDKRYGLFSSGGSSGEDVLKSIICMTSRLLRRQGGFCAIVSEFMNPPLTTILDIEKKDRQNSELLEKITKWWQEEKLVSDKRIPTTNNPCPGTGMLFTNEFPLSGETYAGRRANDAHEFGVWKDHLEILNIRSVSPGLLYIETEKGKHGGLLIDEKLHLSAVAVPKTNNGSIWTPHNFQAIELTKQKWQDVHDNIH